MSNETDFNDIYGGSYLGAADLTAGPVRRRIDRVEVKTLNDKSGGSKRRFVVHLNGVSKELVLNKTNARAVADVLGKDNSRWSGAVLELSVTDTNMGPGVAVKVLTPASAPAASGGDMNDQIPF